MTLSVQLTIAGWLILSLALLIVVFAHTVALVSAKDLVSLACAIIARTFALAFVFAPMGVGAFPVPATLVWCSMLIERMTYPETAPAQLRVVAGSFLVTWGVFATMAIARVLVRRFVAWRKSW
jgi:hypothetical protein